MHITNLLSQSCNCSGALHFVSQHLTSQRPCTSRTTSMRLGMVPTPRSWQRQERGKATSRRMGGGASWSTRIRSRKDPHQTASCWARSPERQRSQPSEELQPGVLSWQLNTSSTRPRSTPAPASLSRAPSDSLLKDGSALSLEALVNSGESGATHWGNRW
jgi:hypothetical protein